MTQLKRFCGDCPVASSIGAEQQLRMRGPPMTEMILVRREELYLLSELVIKIVTVMLIP